MDSTTSFGRWIKLRRIALDLTQHELGQRAGCSTMTIRKIEADERRPSRQLAEHLAQHLNVAAEERAAFLQAARAERCPDRLAAPMQVMGQPRPTVPRRPQAYLPVPATPLIGREHEFVMACTLLRHPDVRLVTLTGAGGTGKTRLGLQVATALLDNYADGVWFVDLAPLRDPHLVLRTMAQVLGVRETRGLALLKSLQTALRNRQLLLLLDNFEQVLAAAAQLADLLAAAPKLKILVTSRAPLRLSGEHEFPVPPLALPDRHAPPSLEQLAACDSVALFVARAQAVQPSFQITAENAQAIAGICARLDGLPLAIELAAARSRVFPPEMLLARLAHRLEFLTGGPRDLPERQRTIRATLDWSYHLLPEAEQRLFMRLAVFVGGFTTEAAEAVCKPAGDRTLNIPAGLESLVEHHLLRVESGLHSQHRFRRLETIREYALERLEASGEAAVLRRHHAAYYAALVETGAPHSIGLHEVEWHDRLELEHDNVRAALRWARKAGDGELGLRIATAIWPFWRRRGYLTEGRQWLEGLLEVPDGRRPAVPAALQAQALLAAGMLALDVGDFAHGIARVDESRARYERLGDKAGVAWALNSLGHGTCNHGDVTRGQALCEEALTLFRELGDKRGIATALFDLAMCAWLQDDHALSDARAEESIPLFRELGDTGGLAWSLWRLGENALVRRDYARAAAKLEESAALFRRLGDRWSLTACLLGLGHWERYRGNSARARMLYEESLAMSLEVGDTKAVVEKLLYLGTLARAEGDFKRALALGRESLGLRREVATQYVVQCLIYLAGIVGLPGDRASAVRAARLFGAVERFGEDISIWVPLDVRAVHERDVLSARSRLGEAAFATAWAEGRAMTLEQAIAYVLEESSPEAIGGSTAAEPIDPRP